MEQAAATRQGSAARTWARATLSFAAASGLTIQAGLAAALLVFWFEHPATFRGLSVPYPLPYLNRIGAHSLLARSGTPVFVASLVAWVAGYAGLRLSRRLAPGVLIGAGLLSAFSFWLSAIAYPGPYGFAGSLGVLALGLVPLACLVALHGDLPIRPPVLAWCLASAGMLAAVLIAAGPPDANPYLIAGRAGAPVFLAGLWAVGVGAAVIAGSRWPRAALAAAVLNLPMVLIRAGNQFCCSPPDVGPPGPVPFGRGSLVAPGGPRWEPVWLAAEVALLLVSLWGFRRGRI